MYVGIPRADHNAVIAKEQQKAIEPVGPSLQCEENTEQCLTSTTISVAFHCRVQPRSLRVRMFHDEESKPGTLGRGRSRTEEDRDWLLPFVQNLQPKF